VERRALALVCVTEQSRSGEQPKMAKEGKPKPRAATVDARSGHPSPPTCSRRASVKDPRLRSLYPTQIPNPILPLSGLLLLLSTTALRQQRRFVVYKTDRQPLASPKFSTQSISQTKSTAKAKSRVLTQSRIFSPLNSPHRRIRRYPRLGSSQLDNHNQPPLRNSPRQPRSNGAN
jgi:hypothetical protein